MPQNYNNDYYNLKRYNWNDINKDVKSIVKFSGVFDSYEEMNMKQYQPNGWYQLVKKGSRKGFYCKIDGIWTLINSDSQQGAQVLFGEYSLLMDIQTNEYYKYETDTWNKYQEDGQIHILGLEQNQELTQNPNVQPIIYSSVSEIQIPLGTDIHLSGEDKEGVLLTYVADNNPELKQQLNQETDIDGNIYRLHENNVQIIHPNTNDNKFYIWQFDKKDSAGNIIPVNDWILLPEYGSFNNGWDINQTYSTFVQNFIRIQSFDLISGQIDNLLYLETNLKYSSSKLYQSYNQLKNEISITEDRVKIQQEKYSHQVFENEVQLVGQVYYENGWIRIGGKNSPTGDPQTDEKQIQIIENSTPLDIYNQGYKIDNSEFIIQISKQPIIDYVINNTSNYDIGLNKNTLQGQIDVSSEQSIYLLKQIDGKYYYFDGNEFVITPQNQALSLQEGDKNPNLFDVQKIELKDQSIQNIYNYQTFYREEPYSNTQTIDVNVDGTITMQTLYIPPDKPYKQVKTQIKIDSTQQDANGNGKIILDGNVEIDGNTIMLGSLNFDKLTNDIKQGLYEVIVSSNNGMITEKLDETILNPIKTLQINILKKTDNSKILPQNINNIEIFKDGTKITPGNLIYQGVSLISIDTVANEIVLDCTNQNQQMDFDIKVYFSDGVNLEQNKQIDIQYTENVSGPVGPIGPSGNYIDYIFKNSETMPQTPEQIPNPVDWYNEPQQKNVGEYTWMSKQEKKFDGSLVSQSWSSPIRITGEQGQQGEPGGIGGFLQTKALIEIPINPNDTKDYSNQNFNVYFIEGNQKKQINISQTQSQGINISITNNGTTDPQINITNQDNRGEIVITYDDYSLIIPVELNKQRNIANILKIIPENGTIIRSYGDTLNFITELVSLDGSINNVDQQWELLDTQGNVIQNFGTLNELTISSQDYSYHQIIKQTYNNSTQYLDVYDQFDNLIPQIKSLNGSIIQFKKDGTVFPTDGTLEFQQDVYKQTNSELQNPQNFNYNWSVEPEPDGINSTLYIGNTPSQQEQNWIYLSNTNQQNVEIQIGYGYEDTVTLNCEITDTSNNNIYYQSIPITIVRDGESQSYILIESLDGNIILNNKQPQNLNFEQKYFRDSNKIQFEDTQQIEWYLNGSIKGNGSSISIPQEDFININNELKVVYNELEYNVSITNIKESVNVTIESSNGNIFKNGNVNTTLTQKLFEGQQEITTDISYQWYSDLNGSYQQLANATSNSLTVTDQMTNKNTQFKCIITYKNKTYSQFISIVDVTDSYYLAVDVDNNFQETNGTSFSPQNVTINPKLVQDNVIQSCTFTIYKPDGSSLGTISSGSNINIQYTSIFTQSERNTINQEKQLIVKTTYEGIEYSQTINVVMKNSNYTWLQNWKNNTTITDNSIATGKFFAGQNDQTTGLSGIYVGDTSTFEGKTFNPGITQLKENTEKFKLFIDQNKDIFLNIGNTTDSNYITYDTNTGKLKVEGDIYANNGTFTGEINASSGSITGQLSVGNMLFGVNVNSTNDGIYINSDNYWYDNGVMKVGNQSQYIKFDGSNVTTTGTINAKAGTFSGNITLSGSIKNSSKTYGDTTQGMYLGPTQFEVYKDQTNYFKFDTTNGLEFKGKNSSILSNGSGSLANGNITWDTQGAQNFKGTLTVGSMKIGPQVSSTNDGIYIGTNNYWYDNGTFKVGNQSYNINWDNSNIKIKAKGFNLSSTGLQLTEGNINLGSDSIILNNDGSGSLANGNITWNTQGTSYFKGDIEQDSGKFYSTNHENFNDSVQGFWLGKDTDNKYKFSIGNSSEQKFMQFDGNYSYLVGDLFGQFIGDSYLYNTEFKSDPNLSNDIFGEIIYDQKLQQVYKYPDTGLELLRTYGSNQQYILQLQNTQIQPQNQYQPQTGIDGISAYTSVTINNSYSNKTSASNQPFYRVEVLQYKTFPQNYFKGETGGQKVYQTVVFDFSNSILYGAYTESTNIISVKYNKDTREITVLLKNSSGTTLKSVTKKQKSDIEKINYRTFSQIKQTQNMVDNGMSYTFTTKDMGHQLVQIQADPDQEQENLSKFDKSLSTNNVYGIIKQRTFDGVATSSYFADLQEKIWVDEKIKKGEPVQIKNGKMCKANNPKKKTWIVSSNPGLKLGSKRENQIYIALQGTVVVNCKCEIDDEICLNRHGKLKKANFLDKLTGKYIIGKIIKKEDSEQLLLLY